MHVYDDLLGEIVGYLTEMSEELEYSSYNKIKRHTDEEIALVA